MYHKDLHTILEYNGKPIRVGVIDDELMLCLYDLLNALNREYINVTYSVRKIPDSLYFPVSTIDLDGRACNGKVIAVTEEGAIMTLSRVGKIDLTDVLRLFRWIKRLDKNKIKKGA